MFRRDDLISIFLVVLISVLSVAEFPSDVKRCKAIDSDCQKVVLQEIIKKFPSTGHRTLNLIPFDPLDVKSLNLPKVEGSPVNIELKFKDIVLTGISKVTVNKVSGLKDDGIYEIEAHFPQIVISGPYSVNGTVLVLAITGQGKSKIVFDNINAKIKGKTSIVEKEGKKFLKVDKIHIDLEPEKTTFSFEGLFGGDKTLGDNMNKFLNENWKEIYSELKPVIMEAISKIGLTIANGVFSKFEYSEIFLPS